MSKAAVVMIVTGLLIALTIPCSLSFAGREEELEEAALEGRLEKVQQLLDKYDGVIQRDSLNAALFAASQFNRWAVVKLLLERGADVNAADEAGVTVLMNACSFGLSAPKSNVIRLLLESGADVNTKDKRAVTALMYASAEEDPSVVRVLLDKGADVNARDKDGHTALILAAKYGRLDYITMLLDARADPNAKDEDGNTALRWVSGWQDGLEPARLLVEKGADVNAKNGQGETAMNMASKHGHAEIVELLKAHGAKE